LIGLRVQQYNFVPMVSACPLQDEEQLKVSIYKKSFELKHSTQFAGF